MPRGIRLTRLTEIPHRRAAFPAAARICLLTELNSRNTHTNTNETGTTTFHT
jgi:hypothetical protein